MLQATGPERLKGWRHLIALACSPVPDGHDNHVAGKELGLVESLSPETVA